MAIFVRIASYRDSELVPTLVDCLNKARWPADLRFGICWQHDKMESLADFSVDSRFRILDVDYLVSRGMGWARSECARLYDGEEFTISLDSHHRFIEGWDQLLIEMMGAVPTSKPVLTTYPPSYDPDPNGSFQTEPTLIKFVNFNSDGTLAKVGIPIDEFDSLAPVPSRFYAGGCAFSAGRFLEEVPPDPHIYFSGEEDSIAIRAFTHGYDLFHPHRIICWHQYERRDKPKHWSDHVAGRTRGPEWHELEACGVKRFRRLLGLEPVADEVFGSYGLGAARSFNRYQKFTGLNFAKQTASIAARAGRIPRDSLATGRKAAGSELKHDAEKPDLIRWHRFSTKIMPRKEVKAR
jgi:Glycosyltransferase (GlcNAc)